MKNIIWPVIMASLVTAIDIAYRNLGMESTDGPLTAYFLEFILIFLGTFCGALVYSRAVKNEHNYTCPQCRKAFSHHGFSVANCPDCQVRGEPTKGFTDRHPD